MSISRITSTISHSVNGVSQRVVRAVPSVVVEGDKTNRAIAWVGEKLSSPHNRLILGVTALMSQPFIDLNNKKVDEQTRIVSAARTVAKIIAGTLTGFSVRYLSIKAIDAFSKLPEQINDTTKFKRLRTLFTPTSALNGVLKDLTQYKFAYGTYLSLGVMLFTNFLIDAPLTKFLTNIFLTGDIHGRGAIPTTINEVKSKREVKNG
ncbi:hypothetical protein IJO12_01245 [bacterium]|nr:hypothetical protein [bacterium]